MLLGVSIGVVCNLMFPEWLITALFAAFLASSTFKTCSAGFKYWRLETEEARRGEAFRLERVGNEVDEKGMEEPLLGGREEGGLRVPWKDLAVLLTIWLCFFALHVLLGDKARKVRFLHSPLCLSPCLHSICFHAKQKLPMRFRSARKYHTNKVLNPPRGTMYSLGQMTFYLNPYATFKDFDVSPPFSSLGSRL